MKLKSLLLLFFITPLLSLAQERRNEHGNLSDTRRDEDRRDGDRRDGDHREGEGSTLTIFSENGDQFFLIINGIKQNNYLQTKVRVEDLPQDVNDIQILFADNFTHEIEKRITISDPLEGKPVSLVLKIVREERGHARLHFVKSTELMRDYHPEQDEYVMHYGRDIIRREVVVVNTPPPPPPAPVGPFAMDERTFNDLKRSINDASFEDTKLSTAKTVLNNNYVTTNQVIDLCNLFSFENNKLEIAKFAYKKTVDQNNYFNVGNVFNFDSSRKSLNDFINGKR